MNSKKYFLILIASFALLSACTGGYVYRNGRPIDAKITVYTCSDKIFRTTTSSFTGYKGRFYFNPYNPYSADIDDNQIIPTGQVLIRIDDIEDYGHEALYPADYFVIVAHQYDERCDVLYNNRVQNLPCKKYEFDFDNASTEGNQKAKDDFVDICNNVLR